MKSFLAGLFPSLGTDPNPLISRHSLQRALASLFSSAKLLKTNYQRPLKCHEARKLRQGNTALFDQHSPESYGQMGAPTIQLATPNWFTNALLLLNPKTSEKQVSSQESQQKRRQVYNLYFEAKEKKIPSQKTNTYKVILLWEISCAIK